MPEMLVASLLTVVVGALTLTAVVGPIEAMRRSSVPDARRIEVEAAADAFARTVRAARPGLRTGPVVSIARDRIVLRVGPPVGARTVVVEVVDGDLLLRDEQAVTVPEEARILLRHVGTDGFVLSALDARGEVVPADDPRTVAAVVLRIEVDGHRAERTVALRSDAVHAQAVGW